jgi:hypothetical protein
VPNECSVGHARRPKNSCHWYDLRGPRTGVNELNGCQISFSIHDSTSPLSLKKYPRMGNVSRVPIVRKYGVPRMAIQHISGVIYVQNSSSPRTVLGRLFNICVLISFAPTLDLSFRGPSSECIFDFVVYYWHEEHSESLTEDGPRKKLLILWCYMRCSLG